MKTEPLATLLRPKKLTHVVGQSHLVGPDKPLSKAIASNQLFSMILWGPPGVGKTTLARVISHETNRQFIEISAVSSGKADLKQIVLDAQKSLELFEDHQPPIVFIDEIHRFNKAQQDFLLPYVENGTIVLVGATTENPSFEVISALLSRCRVFVLEPLTSDEQNVVINTALAYFSELKLQIDDDARDWLINFSTGDARKLLTLLDQSVELFKEVTVKSLKATAQSTHLSYDKSGEEHYNTISAFIKSMRASDPNAALYYLARMVAAGEDPKFIARRMVIFASEDIGLAQPTALVVANAVFDAVHKIGYPEAQINLAHGVAYLCQAKKNRTAYDAYFAALADVEKYGHLEIPLHLRNAPTKLMKELGYGKEYEMYPESPNNLPKKLGKKKYLK